METEGGACTRRLINSGRLLELHQCLQVTEDDTQVETLPSCDKTDIQQPSTGVMLLLWVCALLAVGSPGTASAQTQAKDPLECSPEEYVEAQHAIPRNLNVFYKPLLTEDFSEIRNTLTNENSVRWHVNCILYDKACTRLGKAMQYFVTSQGGGRACKSCQITCVQRRIRTVLYEIYCKHPLISQEIRDFFFRKNQIDIITYFLGNNPVC